MRRENQTTPRAGENELEIMGQTKLGSFWLLRTNDTLEEVFSENYFLDVASHGLRVTDRIKIIAEANSDEPQHATATVRSVTMLKVEVDELCRFAPPPPKQKGEHHVSN